MTYPEWPNKIGKRSRRKNPDGGIRTFSVVDEIRHQQHNAPHKLLYLQMIRADDDGSEELRFCYYIIGKKERSRGK